MRAKKTFATRDKDTMICISEVDGDPVGYVLAKIFTQDESADNGTGRMGLLDELYLKESARGMGLGQRMIDETIQWMKEKAVSRVKLHAYSWNDTAKNLYQRNGFKEYAASFEVFI
jgi:ribosomal protein S18 acetylase RimI-like enzyme